MYLIGDLGGGGGVFKTIAAFSHPIVKLLRTCLFLFHIK